MYVHVVVYPSVYLLAFWINIRTSYRRLQIRMWATAEGQLTTNSLPIESAFGMQSSHTHRRSHSHAQDFFVNTWNEKDKKTFQDTNISPFSIYLRYLTSHSTSHAFTRASKSLIFSLIAPHHSLHCSHVGSIRPLHRGPESLLPRHSSRRCLLLPSRLAESEGVSYACSSSKPMTARQSPSSSVEVC